MWSSLDLPNKKASGVDHYIGQLLHDKPHGPGILLTNGATFPYVYIGSFENGFQNGYGIILTPRGESFQGFYKDGETYGPGSYTFPRPLQEPQIDQDRISDSDKIQSDYEIDKNNTTACSNNIPTIKRHRVRFDGMNSGRPLGKGVVVWSDGTRESGEFDGMELKRHVSMEACQGVLLVAAQNAEMAKRVAAETEDELRRRGFWEGQADMLIAKGKGSL